MTDKPDDTVQATHKNLVELAEVFAQHVEYTVQSNKDILGLCETMAERITALGIRISQLEDLHRLEEHKND